MAGEQVPNPAPTPPPPPESAPPATPPLQTWLARLGTSGKILAAGGLVGVIAVFLPLLGPLYSVSAQVQMPVGANPFGGQGGVNMPAVSTSQIFLVVRDWRGVLCLVGYLATLALAFVLYPPHGLNLKALGWAGAGVGALLVLLALWLLLLAFETADGIYVMGQASFRDSVGVGAILNVLAAAAVAAGGFLKAREERLF